MWPGSITFASRILGGQKGRAKAGRPQSVVLKRQVGKESLVIEILRRLKMMTPTGTPLAKVSMKKYRKLFELVVTRLNSRIRYTPHSPRGVASDGYLMGRSIEQLMIDGRWSVLASFKQYLDVAAALEVTVSQETRHLIEAGAGLNGNPEVLDLIVPIAIPATRALLSRINIFRRKKPS